MQAINSERNGWMSMTLTVILGCFFLAAMTENKLTPLLLLEQEVDSVPEGHEGEKQALKT